jgi:zinc and cadmium transporter
MTLTWIVLATLAGGVLSVVVAASLTVGLLARVVRHLVSLSAGVLLGTALLQVLPEAFEGGTSPERLFLALLGGLLFFFLLEKAELYRHGHHHEGDDPHHHHHHGFDAEQAGHGGWSVLLGDSIHNFCDGVIIAAAFLTDTRLGVATALAVVAHEIPQEVGDYIVLLNAGLSRTRLLHRRAVAGALSLPAGGGVEQLHLRRRGRPASAAAAPLAVARYRVTAGMAGGRAGARGHRPRLHPPALTRGVAPGSSLSAPPAPAARCAPARAGSRCRASAPPGRAGHATPSR